VELYAHKKDVPFMQCKLKRISEGKYPASKGFAMSGIPPGNYCSAFVEKNDCKAM